MMGSVDVRGCVMCVVVKEEQFRAPAIRALCRITEVFVVLFTLLFHSSKTALHHCVQCTAVFFRLYSGQRDD